MSLLTKSQFLRLGTFGVPAVVENPGGGQARREKRATDDLIPIMPKASLDRDTPGQQPAILDVSAQFGIVLSKCGAPGQTE